MAKDAEREAKKIAAVQKRWEALQQKEEEKKKRDNQKDKKPGVIRRLIRVLNAFFQAIADFLMRPIHAIHDSYLREKRKRLARKKARAEKRRPMLEAKARKRIEKKRRKEAKREAKRLEREAKRKGKLPLGKRLVKDFNDKTDALAKWIASPANAYREMQAKKRLKKIEKKKAKLEKTAASREKKAQKRHRKLVKKEQKRLAKIAARKKRWKWLREKWAVFKEFWAYTIVVRKLIYLIGFFVLIYVKRDYLLAKLNSFTGFDLQSLLQ